MEKRVWISISYFFGSNKSEKSRSYFLAFLLILFILFSGKSSGENIRTKGDFRISNTSMKIGRDCSIQLNSDFVATATAQLWNNGSFYFSNGSETILELNTILSGDGMFYITGGADCFLRGEGAAITSLTLNSGRTFFVETDLSITDKLALESGILEVSEDKIIKVQSTSVDAIVFNDSNDNSGFITGSLVRNTTPDRKYSYPVGTSVGGFHPFALSEVSSSNYIGVTYSPGLATDRLISGTGHISVSEEHCWEVITESEGITFQPSLGLYSPNGILQGAYNIFYSAAQDLDNGSFSLDYNSQLNAQETYLKASNVHSEGVFALSEVLSLAEDEAVPELVNLLVQNGSGRSTFEVPGVFSYDRVVLLVFNRFGNKVYENTRYENNFDVNDFPEGTYYYELTLDKGQGEKVVLRNLLEIISPD